MTLPASGAISINSLVGEYGGSTPHSMNEYYKGGSLVLNHSNNANVPTSGTISLNNFYGQSNAQPFDATLAGTAGNSTVTNKAASSYQQGVGNAQPGVTIGSWSDNAFTNPSGNTSFTIVSLTTFYSTLHNFNENDVLIQLSGNYSSNSSFSNATGWRYVKLGTTIIFDSNDNNIVSYNSTSNFTEFKIMGGFIYGVAGANSHNNRMPTSGTFTATLSN